MSFYSQDAEKQIKLLFKVVRDSLKEIEDNKDELTIPEIFNEHLQAYDLDLVMDENYLIRNPEQ
jgi:hypothetical protein